MSLTSTAVESEAQGRGTRRRSGGAGVQGTRRRPCAGHGAAASTRRHIGEEASTRRPCAGGGVVASTTRRHRRGGGALDVGGAVEGAGVEAAGEEPDRGGGGKGTGQLRRTEDAGRAGRGGEGRSAECGGRREGPRQYI